MPGFGSQPVRAAASRLPSMMPPARAGGVSGSGIVNGGVLPLPGSSAYSAQYKDRMRTPEVQNAFQQQAIDQARFANALNPYSMGYNADVSAAASAAQASRPNGDPFNQAWNGQFREVMGQALTSSPQGPIAGTGLTPIKPPMAPPVAQPPVTTTGMNNFAAADALRKKKRRAGTGGPTAPPQLA